MFNWFGRQLRHYQRLLYPVLDFPLNGVNYLFVIVVSWHLTSLDLGKSSAILGLLAVMMVMGTTLQAMVAKQVSARPSEQFVLPRFTLNLFIALVVVGMILSPLIAEFIHSTQISVLLLISALALHQGVSVLRGHYQGHGRFFIVNGSLYAEIGTKFILALVLLPNFPTYTTVIFCSMAGFAASLIYHLVIGMAAHKGISTVRLYQIIGYTPVNNSGTGAIRDYINLLLGNLGTQYFIAIDIILFNFFQPTLSGQYAIVAKYGQLVFYLSLSMQTVLLPMLTRGTTLPMLQQKRLLLRLLSSYMLVSILVIGLYRTLAPFTVPIFFKAIYADVGQYLWLIASAYALLAIIQLLSLFVVIQNRSFHLWILVASALSITVGFILFHDSIASLIEVQIVVYSGTIIAFYLAMSRTIVGFGRNSSG